ncbi:MAG: PqqD family peptide modification chaperone [Actinomycetota bacterium]
MSGLAAGAAGVGDAAAVALGTAYRRAGVEGVESLAGACAAVILVREDWDRLRRRVATIDLEIERISVALGRGAPGLSPPILFKGRAVASEYADPSLRPYVDIDLIVPAPEIRAWLLFLEGLGYENTRPWKARDLARYQAGVSSWRSIGPYRVLCDVHWCVFIERSARNVDYHALLPGSEPTDSRNVLAPSPPAQLVALALHYASHPRPTRRLIWLRDFVELGRLDLVAEARSLADEWGVGWALERALLETEVAVREVADELVLLDLEDGEFFVARGVGPRVWELLAAGRSTEEIVDEIVERYDDVDRDQAQRDVDGFIASAEERGLIEEVSN